MGKGSNRRPEDATAVARHWPLKRKKVRDYIGPAVIHTSRCPFCYREITPCAMCGRPHCPCVPLSNCQDNRPWQRRPVDPLTIGPHGFKVLGRSGFAGGRSHE